MTSVKRFLPIQGPGAAASALVVLGVVVPILGANPVLGWVTAQLLPGVGAALFLPPAGTPVLLARSLLLGPVVTGLLGMGLGFLGAGATLPWVVWGFGVLAILAATSLRRRGWLPDGGVPAGAGAAVGPGDPAASGAAAGAQPDPGVRVAMWIGLALGALVLAPGLVHPWMRERADSWFHAAVVAEIGYRGLPPQDPYFAGVPLKYMWFYHVILAGFTQMTGLSVFLVMTLLNATALWALCVAAADLPAALWRAGRPGAFSALIVPLGLCALFWVFLPLRVVRALRGPGGADALWAALGDGRIDIAHTRLLMSDFGSVPFFLNKFLIGTALGPAMALFLIYLAGLARYAGTRRGIHLVTVGVSMTAMLILHPVVGLTAAAVSGLTGVALVLLRPDRGGMRLADAVKWGVVVAVAAAPVAPYLRAITSSGPGQQMKLLRIDWWVLAGIFVGCFFVILAAARPIRDLWRQGGRGGAALADAAGAAAGTVGGGRVAAGFAGPAAAGAGPAGRMMVVWTAMTVLFAALVQLPRPNSIDKFTYLVYLPFAAMAGIWAAGAWRGRRGALLALLVLGPANLIGYAAYWGEPEWRERSPEIVEAWRWLADNTPTDAVVVENRERVEAAVTVPRRLYWGELTKAVQWGYDPFLLGVRQAAREAIYTPGQAPEAGTFAALRGVRAPVYVIFRAEDFTSPDDFHKLDRFPGDFDLVFKLPTVRIYRLKS